MEQTYLYEVRPHKIITGIHGVPYIRTPRAVYLTKDEVLICLQKGSVYRRFANLDKLERVTVTNVDRLHNEKFISEEEWIGTKKEDAPVAPPGEPKKEETQPLEQAAKEDNGVVDSADEATSTETEKEAPVEESSEAVEESSDDSEAIEGEEEKADEAEPQQQNNIQFKNHHNNKKHNKK